MTGTQIQKGALIILGRGPDGVPTAVSVDENGSLLAAMKGAYGETPKTIAVGEDGRMLTDLTMLESQSMNFNSYARACNNRVSLSSVCPSTWVIYVVNAAKSFVVLRNISVRGMDLPGIYQLKFSTPNVIRGAVGVMQAVTDNTTYKYTLATPSLELTETNCKIEGLVADYFLSEAHPAITSSNGKTYPVSDPTDWRAYYPGAGLTLLAWTLTLNTSQKCRYCHIYMTVYSPVAQPGGISVAIVTAAGSQEYLVTETFNLKTAETLTKCYHISLASLGSVNIVSAKIYVTGGDDPDTADKVVYKIHDIRFTPGDPDVPEPTYTFPM